MTRSRCLTFFNLCMVLFSLFLFARSSHAFVLGGIVPDPSCVEFHPTGNLCVAGVPPRVGIEVAYWIPSVVIETTPQCGVTYLPPPVNAEVAAVAPIGCSNGLMDPLLSSSYQSVGDVREHRFADVHVAWIPMPLDLVLKAIGFLCFDISIAKPGLVYASEPDFLHWRLGYRDILNGLISSVVCSVPGVDIASVVGGSVPNGLLDKIPGAGKLTELASKYCMGAWGPTYPRVGNLNTLNRIVHSAAIAYRGVLLAKDLMAEPPDWLKDLVDGSSSITTTDKDKLQLIWPPSPNPIGCVRIGWPAGEIPPAIPWDTALDGPHNVNEHFIWLHWRYVKCCML